MKLGEIAEFVNGAAFSESDWSDSGMKIIRIQNLTDATKPFNRTNRQVKDSIVVRSGDLLVSWSATLGVFEWSEPESALLNQHIFRVIPDLRRVDKCYLRHVLSVAVSDMGRHTHGATMKHINRAEFLGTSVPLPPLDEQRRIALILDAADALRTKRRQALEKLESLTQSIFIDMFGDPRSDYSRFARRQVGALARNEDAARRPVKMSDRADLQGVYPYYGASGVIDHVDDYLFDGQRLLVAEDGANLLARSSPIAFLADGKYWVNNHAHVLADIGVANLTFLRQAIESLDLTRYVTGSAQPKLTRRMLDSIEVPAPDRALQDEFERRVLEIKQIETASRQHISCTELLFSSLQHRAFRGEL